MQECRQLSAKLAPVEELPDEVVLYLLSSRYCETDRMTALAWSLFGHTPPGWARVQAIVDYAHERIEFGYHHARPTKTAWDAHEERQGVCRDFAHLPQWISRDLHVRKKLNRKLFPTCCTNRDIVGT